jgi:hypothetical protein
MRLYAILFPFPIHFANFILLSLVKLPSSFYSWRMQAHASAITLAAQAGEIIAAAGDTRKMSRE